MLVVPKLNLGFGVAGVDWLLLSLLDEEAVWVRVRVRPQLELEVVSSATLLVGIREEGRRNVLLVVILLVLIEGRVVLIGAMPLALFGR